MVNWLSSSPHCKKQRIMRQNQGDINQSLVTLKTQIFKVECENKLTKKIIYQVRGQLLIILMLWQLFEYFDINITKYIHYVFTQYNYRLNRLLKLKAQKMSSYVSSLPRSIHFEQSMAQNFQAVGSCLSQNKENTRINQNNSTTGFRNDQYQSPFDLYNKKNLLLITCKPEDVQIVTKSPLVYEESVQVKPNPQATNFQRQTIKAKTATNFNPSSTQNNKSKEAELNQFLFNHRKKTQQKKAKKINFLTEIQKKLNYLEKEAVGFEQNKEREYHQLNGILNIHSQMKHQASKNEMMGKINRAIIQSEVPQNQGLKQPQALNEKMQFLEINAAIDDQHEYNDYILGEIQKISLSHSKQKMRGKSGEKSNKDRINQTNKTSNNFGKTLKKPAKALPPRPYSASKKMTSTWKGAK